MNFQVSFVTMAIGVGVKYMKTFLGILDITGGKSNI